MLDVSREGEQCGTIQGGIYQSTKKCATGLQCVPSNPYQPESLSYCTKLCPDTCYTCQDGESWNGGQMKNDQGYCEHYCSEWNNCGDGDKYQKYSVAVCHGCKITANQILEISLPE